MTEVKRAKLDTLTPDHANANKGTERGRYALEASLRQFGAGRSILLDKNGRIIAGNKTVETAADVGLDDVLIVQTDGKQIVAVQRTDLDIDSEAGRGLAYADNRVGQLDLEWDAEQVLADLNAGVDLSALWRQDELDQLLGISDDLYTRKIESPVYVPTGEKPEIGQLFDDSKTIALVQEIKANQEITQSEKDFLIIAAQRHTVLRFDLIAEYYAHSSFHVQRLMENSALVIIDFNRAIELGFIELSKNIIEMIQTEYE